MNRFVSSSRFCVQVVSLLAVFGFMSIGEVSAQWLPHGNGTYTNVNVGIKRPPSSWISLDVNSSIRLNAARAETKGWGTQLHFADVSSTTRFLITDDFSNNCLTFHKSVNKGYFQFEGPTVMATNGGAAHKLPTGAHDDFTLAVNGKIVAKEVVVTTSGWADYVFASDYELMPLESVANHIQVNGYLHNMPSAAEVV
ncbi:MAG: hypothetical protein AAFO91_17215, partial [Bacteroidota bacterium]